LVREVRSLPRLTRFGFVVMAVGVIADLIEHTLVPHQAQVIADFPVQQHLAHLTVMVGMVLVLAGIALFGARVSQSRAKRPEGSVSDAHR
jgi:uncharacterized protein YjeT (DUF2065 family)